MTNTPKTLGSELVRNAVTAVAVIVAVLAMTGVLERLLSFLKVGVPGDEDEVLGPGRQGGRNKKAKRRRL